MIELGLACSHAAGMFRPPEAWRNAAQNLSPGVLERYPAAREELENLELCRELHRRIHAGFETMRQEIRDYQPDAIILVGDDQNDVFDSSNNPTIAVYTGEEPMWGRTGYEAELPTEQRSKVYVNNHVELSRYLLRSLVKQGFDISNIAKFKPVGREGYGLSHMAARIAPELDPTGQIPVICVFLNEYFEPLPTGKRCAQLGRAIQHAFADRPEKIAICASGGLSHYPPVKGMKRGDIDVALDKWVLDQIERNDVDSLEQLFAIESDTLRSGTGEIRAWITVAAAMARKAKVIDYMPIHSLVTGIAFSSWK